VGSSKFWRQVNLALKWPKVAWKIIGEWNTSKNGVHGPIKSFQQYFILSMWETDTIADVLQGNV